MDNQNRAGISPLIAGLTGFLLGIAGTITLAMTDGSTRNRTTKKAHELKNNLLQWSDDTVNTFQKKSYEVRKDLANRIDPDSDISVPSEEQDKISHQHLHN